MKKLLVALQLTCCAVPAIAADLKAPVVPPAPVISSNSFYIGPFGGVSVAPIGNNGDIFGPTSAQQPGFLFGLDGGWGQTFGFVYAGIDVRVAYELQRGCQVVSCVTATTNAFLFQQGGELGVDFSRLGWNMPFGLVLAGRGGVAEKTGNLGGVDGDVDKHGNVLSAYNSTLMLAPYAGVIARVPIGQTIDAFVGWDHVFWGNQGAFNSCGNTFCNYVSMKSEDLITGGIVFRF